MSSPARLSPHPLVVGLSATLADKLPVDQANTFAAQAARSAASGATGTAAGAPRSVEQFVKASNRQDLVKFVGFVAEPVEAPDGSGDWQVLFLDELAERYLLIHCDDIVLHDRAKADGQPFGLIDVVWIKAEGRVTSGGRGEPLMGRFTTGGFMRAGDFRSSMTGGTQTSVSDLGPLCTAFTPCCCNRYSP